MARSSNDLAVGPSSSLMQLGELTKLNIIVYTDEGWLLSCSWSNVDQPSAEALSVVASRLDS